MGVATFTFVAVPRGANRVGVVSILAGPAGARGTVSITGRAWATVLGAGSTSVAVSGGGQLAITATGLTHTHAYVALFSYTQTTEGTTPSTVVPAPTTAFTENVFTGSVTATITGPVSISGTVDTNVLNAPSVTVTNTVDTTTTVSGTVDVQGVAGGTAIGVAGSVTITSGTVDIGTVGGNVSVENVTNGVLQTGDKLVSLGNISTRTGASLKGTVTPNRNYGALLLKLNATMTPAKPLTAVVIPTLGVSCSVPLGAGPSTAYEAIIPLATATTGSLSITIHCQTTVSSGSSCSVYGLTNNPGVMMRADGRGYPLGHLVAQHNTVTSTLSLVAAPSPGLRILLSGLRVSAYATSGTHSPRVTGTIGGTSFNLVMVTTKSGDPCYLPIPPQGLLLDAATGLHIVATASIALTAAAIYDIVA